MLKRIAVGLFLCLTAAPGRTEVSPISLTFFGLYGSPVYPPTLANIAPNAFGFNALVDWQATSYTSFGLGFEQVTFYQAPDFTVPMLNFEARVFPLENERKSFSPYVYGGAGLNLSSMGGAEPIQLKAGLGSRISLVGPLFFDLAVGSHWIQPPASFQYVDFRAGLSLSLGFKEKTQPTPTATSFATPARTAMPTFTATPVASPNPNWTPLPTPVAEAAPVTTLAQVKKYYKLGMKAFMARNYPLALKMLKKSIGTKEIHKAAYYYAETYSTIGVIYQFHAHKVKDHDKKALEYYKKALAIDPRTKSAKAYYKKLKAKVAREEAKKKKSSPKAVPTRKDPVVSTTSSGDITLSTDAPKDAVPASTPAGKGN